MSPRETPPEGPLTPALRGRVLVVGRRADCAGLLRRLAQRGFRCGAALNGPGLTQAAEALRPDAVLLTGFTPAPRAALASIREHPTLKHLPVLADVSGENGRVLRALDVDDWVFAKEELPNRIESALRARRLIERDFLRARRMESLLEITQAATSSLDLAQVLRMAVAKIAKVMTTDRCSVVLVEGTSPRVASVVASVEKPGMEALEIDLAKYPELRRSLETRQTTYVEDASSDPLMAEVRPSIEQLGGMSILVLPLICQDDLLGALFLRLSRAEGAFGRDDQEFAQAVAGAIANSVRNARMHTAINRKKEELESAYVDRYRELGEANRRLKELNRLKDDLIAICSHDLRAPLQVLLGHARLIQEAPLAPAQAHSMEVLIRQGKKIVDLAESLLDRGKGEQEQVSLTVRLLDLGELCHSAVGELQILAQQAGVTLQCSGEARLPAIADEVKLVEVIENLLTNALAHARPGGRVAVRFEALVRPDSDLAKVVVQDDGHGLSEDELHLVFDRYRHGPGGTGLGLAICKEFVELHGGEIWAERPEAGGAAFVFTVPLARTGATSPRPTASAKDEARVLIVEDDPQIASVIEEILRTRYRVEVARDGAEGLAKAHALRPDLIVMNVFLPRLDGLDAVVALKASSDTADIPVILVSSQREIAQKVKALNLGAVDHLHKPFEAQELLYRTERAICARRAQRELVRGRGASLETGQDALTGLHDRRGFLKRMHQEVARARRYGHALCIGLLRLEAPEPAALAASGLALRQKLRAPDVLGHLGNGHFVVMFPECCAEGAQAALARLLTTLGAAVPFKAPAAFLDVPLGELPDLVLARLLGL